MIIYFIYINLINFSCHRLHWSLSGLGCWFVRLFLTVYDNDNDNDNDIDNDNDDDRALYFFGWITSSFVSSFCCRIVLG